jgi:hypothetical protein
MDETVSQMVPSLQAKLETAEFCYPSHCKWKWEMEARSVSIKGDHKSPWGWWWRNVVCSENWQWLELEDVLEQGSGKRWHWNRNGVMKHGLMSLDFALWRLSTPRWSHSIKLKQNSQKTEKREPSGTCTYRSCHKVSAGLLGTKAWSENFCQGLSNLWLAMGVTGQLARCTEHFLARHTIPTNKLMSTPVINPYSQCSLILKTTYVYSVFLSLPLKTHAFLGLHGCHISHCKGLLFLIKLNFFCLLVCLRASLCFF